MDGRAIAVARRRKAQSRESGRAQVAAVESNLGKAVRLVGSDEGEKWLAHTVQLGLVGRIDILVGRGGLGSLGALGSLLEL